MRRAPEPSHSAPATDKRCRQSHTHSTRGSSSASTRKIAVAAAAPPLGSPMVGWPRCWITCGRQTAQSQGCLRPASVYRQPP
eukprot:366301-Chlamydomonas_euryale.AAC.23